MPAGVGRPGTPSRLAWVVWEDGRAPKTGCAQSAGCSNWSEPGGRPQSREVGRVQGRRAGLLGPVRGGSGVSVLAGHFSAWWWLRCATRDPSGKSGELVQWGSLNFFGVPFPLANLPAPLTLSPWDLLARVPAVKPVIPRSFKGAVQIPGGPGRLPFTHSKFSGFCFHSGECFLRFSGHKSCKGSNSGSWRVGASLGHRAGSYLLRHKVSTLDEAD